MYVLTSIFLNPDCTFKNIFDVRPREKNVSIENFLKEIANHPETIGKKLTETEKLAADEEISLEELKETLEDANSGKTPGTDGVDKEFLTRFWNMIGKTIYYAQKTFIEKEKLNEFLESGIIKILQKGGTKGELIKDWRPITLLSQIYKLISGVVAEDKEAAVKWYRLAADQGYADAQYCMGNVYDVEMGVPEGYVRDYMWNNLRNRP